MTGFGNSNGSVGNLEMDVVVKSVNGRYLEVRTHIPRKYLSLESDIVKICKKYFTRGTVDVHIHFVRQFTKGEVAFRTDVAQEWLEKAKLAFAELQFDVQFTTQDILSIPDFVQVQDVNAISDQEKKCVFDAVLSAIENCQKERAREGLNLQATCLNYTFELKKSHREILSQRELYMQDIFTRTKEKFAKVVKEYSINTNEDRLLQEVAHIVERSDIEEELTRFLEHIKNVEILLNSEGSHGKKLDFYAQELLREVNTIGSKSQYVTITQKVVSLKSCIEQLREQVQNIE